MARVFGQPQGIAPTWVERYSHYFFILLFGLFVRRPYFGKASMNSRSCHYASCNELQLFFPDHHDAIANG